MQFIGLLKGVWYMLRILEENVAITDDKFLNEADYWNFSY